MTTYDQGDPMPEYHDVQILVDYTGEDTDTSSARWSRTPTGWKGYKDGFRVYLDWDELTRRWGPLTEPEPQHPGFHGARPFTDADAEFFRVHRQAVDEGMRRIKEEQDRRIKAALRELGHDPDSPGPIPEWIVQIISERMSLGDFQAPFEIRITEEGPSASA